MKGAGPNKKIWGGNACLASSTVFFQTLLKASGFKAWQVLAPKGLKTFYMPNIAFNMVCGGEHVPGTKQDIQEMFFFAMKEKSIKDVFATGTKFFRQFEKNLVRDGLPTGTAKERGFVFPVKDNFEGLNRIKECAGQLGLTEKTGPSARTTHSRKSRKARSCEQKGMYDMRFSGLASRREKNLSNSITPWSKARTNFVNMEDPGSEIDIAAHKLMNEKYGDRVQIVIDDAAVTQLRFIIPFLAAKDRKDRAGNSVLIKLNQAGTFTETCLATEVVLGLADPKRWNVFLSRAATWKSCSENSQRWACRRSMRPLQTSRGAASPRSSRTGQRRGRRNSFPTCPCFTAR